MLFRYAEESDDVRSLWKLCFPGEDEWVELFMRERYCPERTLLMEDAGKPVAMLHYIRSSFCYHGTNVPVTYIYGLGTHPDYRGRGAAHSLMTRICRDSAENGVSLAAIAPASESLFGFYRSMGFGNAFFLSRDEYSRDSINKTNENAVPVPPDGAFKANGVYESVLSRRDHLHRDAAAWRFEAQSAECSGGRMLGLRRDGEFCGYAIYEKKNGAVVAREVFAEDESAYDTLRLAVLDDAKADCATLESPACAHSAQPFAMLRAVEPAAVLALAGTYRPFECELELEDELLPENTARYTVNGMSVQQKERSGGVFITPGQLVETVMCAGPAPYANLLFC